MPDALFIRLLETDDKATALAAAVKNPGHSSRFATDPESFALVPGAPFAYWVSDNARLLFSRHPWLEREGVVARRGVNTNDDFRFLRLKWESTDDYWAEHVKGGEYCTYYPHVHQYSGNRA